MPVAKNKAQIISRIADAESSAARKPEKKFCTNFRSDAQRAGLTHGKTPRKITQSRDDDQRDGVLAFPPADAADLVVGNEVRIGPDALLVKPAADRPAHRV